MKKEMERFSPSIDDARINYEHLHRFFFVRALAKGKVVLDAGCGEGIGSYIFSEKAKFVFGFDIDEECIRLAKEKYKRDNLCFLTGSIHEIPFKEGTFDLVVCLEVIEHVEEQEKAIHEMKRVLKKDGMLIISTPNKKIYSDERNYKNPHHKREFYKEEFIEVLKTCFKNLYLFGQRIVAGSEILPFFHSELTSYRYSIKKEERGFTEGGDYEPMYFIGVVSDVSLDEVISSSYMVDVSEKIFKEREKEIELLSKEVIKRDEHIKKLDEELKENGDYIRKLQGEIEERNRHIKKLDAALLEKENYIKKLQMENEDKGKIINLARRKFEDKNIILDAGSYHGVMDVIKYIKNEINPFSEFELLIRPVDIEKYRNNPLFSRIHIVPQGNSNRLRLLFEFRRNKYKRAFVVIDSSPARNKFRVFGSLLGTSEIYIWDGKKPIYRVGKILSIFTSLSSVPISGLAVLPILMKKVFEFAALPFKFLYLLFYYFLTSIRK
jgi:2-polyprenyl-3-methyl-5-hydroxy-6-metoxy-1,4-benzoquinol methylase